jgi:hypothetical protein
VANTLLTNLAWYWDLSSADATITDQQSGLVLTKSGTVNTIADGGPGGGACIDVGNAAGYYRAQLAAIPDGHQIASESWEIVDGVAVQQVTTEPIPAPPEPTPDRFPHGIDASMLVLDAEDNDTIKGVGYKLEL